jgi:2-phospho-L-lactate/phosphoenolpyruvate guanylyltransferase
MQTLAILPVKRFAAAKQRLTPDLEPGTREILAEAMVRDVLTALADVRRLDGIVVVTSERRALAPARAADAHVLPDAEEAGQSAAAAAGIAHALEVGAERVLLVPGDCPGLHPGEVDDLLAERRSPPAVTIVPDRHGTGTNALLLAPPDAIDPAFGEGSFARHLAAAEAAALEPAVRHPASLLLDVDTTADLEALRAALPLRPRARLRTSEVLSALAAQMRVA